MNVSKIQSYRINETLICWKNNYFDSFKKNSYFDGN